MNVVLEVELDDDMDLNDYEANFRRMFGDERMDAVIGSIDGSIRSDGLTETSMKLEGLDRHLRLIHSYKKLHAARGKAVSSKLLLRRTQVFLFKRRSRKRFVHNE